MLQKLFQVFSRLGGIAVANRFRRIRHDYKPGAPIKSPVRIRRRLHWVLIGGMVPALALWLTLSSGDASATRPAALDDPESGNVRSRPLDIPARTDATSNNGESSELAPRTFRLTIRPGDSLAGLFKQHGLHAADLQKIADHPDAKALDRIRPGDDILLRATRDGRVLSLSMNVDEKRRLRVRRAGGDFYTRVVERPIQRRISHATGRITRSLYADALEAGLSDRLIMNLADIFQWDIDFVLDIRQGDRFTVVYEEHYRDGEKIADGKILAAEIVNRDRSIRAVRYEAGEDQPDYYGPDGSSMRKTFLRAPLDYMRISSRFSRSRAHPVLKRTRAHKGVDYAAPGGTPIKSTGDGRIIFKGRKGGYGNVIIVKHGERYSTLYAHMRAFRRGTYTGKNIRQGEVIGYVGQSGLATGPHLHYEFRINGKHRNPLTVRFPDADPIPEAKMAGFQRVAAPLLAQLEVAGSDERRLASTQK